MVLGEYLLIRLVQPDLTSQSSTAHPQDVVLAVHSLEFQWIHESCRDDLRRDEPHRALNSRGDHRDANEQQVQRMRACERQTENDRNGRACLVARRDRRGAGRAARAERRGQAPPLPTRLVAVHRPGIFCGSFSWIARLDLERSKRRGVPPKVLLSRHSLSKV